jgi:hypothetical protein
MERKALKGYAWHCVESIGTATTMYIRKRADQRTVSTFQNVFNSAQRKDSHAMHASRCRVPTQEDRIDDR